MCHGEKAPVPYRTNYGKYSRWINYNTVIYGLWLYQKYIQRFLVFPFIFKRFLFFKEQSDLIFSQAFDGQSGLVKAGSFYHLKGDDGIKEWLNYSAQNDEVNLGFSQDTRETSVVEFPKKFSKKEDSAKVMKEDSQVQYRIATWPSNYTPMYIFQRSGNRLWNKACTWMFIAALFTITQRWKNLNVHQRCMSE